MLVRNCYTSEGVVQYSTVRRDVCQSGTSKGRPEGQMLPSAIDEARSDIRLTGRRRTNKMDRLPATGPGTEIQVTWGKALQTLGLTIPRGDSVAAIATYLAIFNMNRGSSKMIG